MKRRSAIRNLVFISGGILLLPACDHVPDNASVSFRTIKVNADQEKLLADVANTIIPRTDTPGAGELDVHLLVLKMLDDLYEKEKQDIFFKGLEQLEELTKKRFDNSFVNSTKAEKQMILQSLEQKEPHPAELTGFYAIMKERTIQGYMNSRYVMKNLVKYEIIPSVKYDGYHRV